MATLGTEVLDMFVPDGVDLMATATAKKNRGAVLMAGAGILLFAIAYAKIDWLGSDDAKQEKEETE